jgi:hypothetical protein
MSLGFNFIAVGVHGGGLSSRFSMVSSLLEWIVLSSSVMVMACGPASSVVPPEAIHDQRSSVRAGFERSDTTVRSA